MIGLVQNAACREICNIDLELLSADIRGSCDHPHFAANHLIKREPSGIGVSITNNRLETPT